MSSLEKNRMALNLLSSLKLKDRIYQEQKNRNIARNIKFQEEEFNMKYHTQGQIGGLKVINEEHEGFRSMKAMHNMPRVPDSTSNQLSSGG